MKAQIGSISEGTMLEKDLIPSFVWELRHLKHRSKQLTQIEKSMQKEGYYDSEQCDYDLDSLFDMLNAHSPDYCYFGAHEGDGACYGFWVSMEILENPKDFDILSVSDTSDIPSDYTGHVLHVNDHGNATLYLKTARKLTEIWSIV